MPMQQKERDTDKHVGARVRARRVMCGMGQARLASKLGVTFQQVQKYEKGTNRIGASRLTQIAEALDVDPGFFFEGLPGVNRSNTALPDYLAELIRTPQGRRLAEALVAITDTEMRLRLLQLMELMAKYEREPKRKRK